MPRSAPTTESRFGVELPIFQAPMAGAQGSALAIAVCNAGGLGALPCAMLDPAAIRRELAAVRAGTAAPYAVNFFSHTPPTPDADRERRWRESLAPYYIELGLDPGRVVAAPARVPFGAEAADVLDEFEPPVVRFTGAGSGGITRDLVEQIVGAVKVPVIAAGGIADAAGVAAVLELGAAAAMVGTAYLLCPEATTSAVHRAALGAAQRETALTNLFSGRPARGIVNRLMRELGPMSDAAPTFPLAATAIVPLRAAAERRGSGDFSPLWAGESEVRLRAVHAAELTRALVSTI